jgi:hypothetical protein
MPDIEVARAPAPSSAPAIEDLGMIGDAISIAVERNSALVGAGLKIWRDESTRFIVDFASQNSAIFSRLCECKSPLDVLTVEQDWVRLRSRAYLESSLRFAEAFAAVAKANGAASPRGKTGHSRKLSGGA